MAVGGSLRAQNAREPSHPCLDIHSSTKCRYGRHVTMAAARRRRAAWETRHQRLNRSRRPLSRRAGLRLSSCSLGSTPERSRTGRRDSSRTGSARSARTAARGAGQDCRPNAVRVRVRSALWECHTEDARFHPWFITEFRGMIRRPTTESLCEICAISAICVGFWTTRRCRCRSRF